MLSIFYKRPIFHRLLSETAGRGLLLFRVAVFFLFIVPLPFAVSCSQQQMARLRAEVERRNAASLEREYQSFIEENRRSHARLQQALAVAARAELRHADCAANECWCSGGKLSPVRLSPEEWSQMRDILRRVRPALQPHRESLVPTSQKIWSIDGQGKVVYRAFVPPPWNCFNPQDELALLDEHGQCIYALNIWELCRESHCRASEHAMDSLVLPDEDFHRLYSLPSCRGFLELMPDDRNNFFR